jgi:ADP-glucose pyrophosphorylase
VKKATGGWLIVHAYNKLNDATIPAQTPIPRKEVIIKGMTGSTLLTYFLPKSLWQHIARGSNRYERQTREERIRLLNVRLRKSFSREVASQKFNEQKRQIMMFEDIRPHEILIMIGSIIARSLCPM